LVGLLLVSVLVGRVPAYGPPDPQTTIDKGIKAQGGEANMAKFKAMTWTETGKYYGMGDGLPYTGTYAVQWHGQFCMEIKEVYTVLLEGDKGRYKAGGETKEMTKEELAEQKEGQHAGWVASLRPLKDKKYTLKALGVIKVGEGKDDQGPA